MNTDRLLAHYEKIAEAPDAVPSLRRFILDLAVRGKLVEQDPNDEPASELLKRIAVEKARLVKAGEIKETKALPPVDEAPFEVPRTWLWTRMRQTSSDRGQKLPEADFTYIDVTSIDKEKGVVAAPKVVPVSKAPSRARKLVRKGDVVYSCVRPYLLNVAIVDDEFDPPPIASTAFAILNGHGYVSPRLQWIVLRSPFMVACVEEEMRGQAYPAINDTDFALLPFPLPPLAEQHRIVAKVDELMALCDRLETARTEREATRDRLTTASLARLDAPDPAPAVFQNHAAFSLDNLIPLTTRPDQIKALRQTILNLAVRGKLVPQGPNDEPAVELLKRIAADRLKLEESGAIKKSKPLPKVDTSDAPFDLPAGWTSVRLADISNIVMGQSPPGQTYNTYGEGVPLINGPIEFSEGPFGTTVVNQYTTAPTNFCNKGDFLICVRGSTTGRTNIAAFEACIGRGVAAIQPLFDDGFVRFFLWSMRERIISMGRGIAFPSITRKQLEDLPVPLPPLAEQHRIVAKFDELMALCDRLEASLAACNDTRRRLLDALLHEALAPSAEKIQQDIPTIAQKVPVKPPGSSKVLTGSTLIDMSPE